VAAAVWRHGAADCGSARADRVERTAAGENLAKEKAGTAFGSLEGTKLALSGALGGTRTHKLAHTEAGRCIILWQPGVENGNPG
jgi:hypothetical protein